MSADGHEMSGFDAAMAIVELLGSGAQLDEIHDQIRRIRLAAGFESE